MWSADKEKDAVPIARAAERPMPHASRGITRHSHAFIESFNGQKVTIEYVHVHSGGQAVVGMVATPGVVRERCRTFVRDKPVAAQADWATIRYLAGYGQDLSNLCPKASHEECDCEQQSASYK
jgi:hypothetical protein